jgi:tetratricopeptide (TPR) repeat protein
MTLEVASVSPDGSAEFKFHFDYIRVVRPVGPGMVLFIDNRTPIRNANPFLVAAGPDAAPALTLLETLHKVIDKVFIKADLRFTVDNRGRIQRVIGFDDLWERYRIEAARLLAEPEKRSQLDAQIEGFFGEKAIRKTLGDNFFIPLPEGPVVKGQEWSDSFTFEIGAIHLPTKKTYRIESDPAKLPLRVRVVMEFGTPPPTDEALMKITENRVEGVMTVDLQNGFIPDFHYDGLLEFEAHSIESPSELLSGGSILIDGSIVGRLWEGDRAPEGEEARFFDEGVARFKKQQYDEAIESFRKALIFRPDWAEAHERIGLSYALMHQDVEAIDALREAARLAPGRAETWQNLGAVLNQAAMFEDGVDALKKSISLNPTLVRSHMELGEAYRQMRRYENAVDAYREAARLDPKDAGIHLFMGACYQELGKKEDAIRELREATRLDPQDAGTHYILAGAYKTADRQEDAIAAFKRAIVLEPKNLEYRRDLARYLFALDRFSETIDVLKEAIPLDPEDVDIRVGLATSYFKLGKKDLTIQAIRDIERLDPELAANLQRAVSK